MVKIMMHGCNGVMGQVISKIVEETEGAVMACGVDRVAAWAVPNDKKWR